ncbi:hypothetical protein LXL04_000480 [Taraxacum kok-saghyz]
MSDQGEKTCPLCAEEMDLTDQQLRPCKCGYEICVWCWHHIMDMAEKDNTEGRCPACRTPYNKEKIVGTASKCERLVTGMSVEKKQKPQKGKTKTSEGRKQLGTVRVIQRNLVYIVGLPLNLADEDLLQQKEYFGRYGKVLKVSISRTAAGAIQQFANSTCSVYITYSKEEEAVRSIQSAHGFVLEGRTLRACFGTTKYCHAWLRNAPCTNADCLYLHEFGPEEDSFTKDEIVSAYTRNRVQQITGVTNDMQRRSGNLLPPPADDYSYNTTTCAWPKPLSKTTTTTNQNPANGIKVPVPNGKSTALPAAASWGTRASNSQPSFKESDGSTPALSFSSAVVSPSSQHNEELEEEEEKGSFGNSLCIKQELDKNTSTDKSSTDTSRNYSNPVSDEEEEEEEEEVNNLSIDMSSSSINNNNQRLQSCYESDPFTENTSKESDLVSDLQKKAAINEAEQDMLSFNDERERLRDTQVIHSNNMGHYPVHAHVSDNGGPHPPSSHNTPPVLNDYSSSFSNSNNTQGSKRENGGIDIGEDSIISNILSMDFDPWDESLTSPRNLAKFLGKSDNNNKQPRKAQNSNQSRFSFARQDDDQEPSYGDFGLEYKNSNSNNGIYDGNGFSSFTNHFPMSENNKIPVSRAQVSAPPGFSGPSRPPPPGFTSHERMDQTFDNLSESYFLGNHVRKSVEESQVNDFEFMDPAILAVGGRVNNNANNNIRSNFPSQLNSFESDMRLQLLMQRSFSQQNLNPRFTQVGLNINNYPQNQTDSYSRMMMMMENGLSLSSHHHHHHHNHQQPRSSVMSNSHWNGIESGNGNERLGLGSRYYSGHEDAKFQIPSRGDLYNPTFGI